MFTEKLGFALVADEYRPEQDKRWVLVAPPGADDNAAPAPTPPPQQNPICFQNRISSDLHSWMSDSSDPAPEPHDPASQALAATDPTEQGAPPPAGYDPADYRWVPVRRRPRYDGWTEEKQRRFIVLADTGPVSAAA